MSGDAHIQNGFPLKARGNDKAEGKATNALGSQIIREIVIPALTKEINNGKNFSQLRQIYNSLILAAWYKKKIKDSILSQVYVDKNKVAGVNIDDPHEKQKIYEQYLVAFKKGAYNYIKEEVDPATQEMIPKKYFSGGFSAQSFSASSTLEITTNDRAMRASAAVESHQTSRVHVQIESADISPPDSMNKKIQEHLDSVVTTIVNDFINLRKVYGSGYQFKAFDPKFISNLTLLLAQLRSDEKKAYFFFHFNKQWVDEGFANDFGSIFEYLAATYVEQGGTPYHVEQGYLQVYNFLEFAPPLERALALRVMVVAASVHLRKIGLHPENSSGLVGLRDAALDHELLVGNDSDLIDAQLFHRYILSLLELEQTKEWNKIIPLRNGQPNSVGLTYGDMLLWGLILLVDPTLYNQWDWTIVGGLPYTLATIEQKEAFLLRYFKKRIAYNKAAVEFLKRGFSHKSITLPGQKEKIVSLLNRAFKMFAGQTTVKGQRSPFTFAFLNESIESVLRRQLYWAPDNLFLNDPMLMLGYDFKNNSDFRPFRPDPVGFGHELLRQQQAKGSDLYPLYVETYQSPDLSSLLPGLELPEARNPPESQPSSASSGLQHLVDHVDYNVDIPVENEPLNLRELQSLPTDGDSISEIYYRPDKFETEGIFYKLLNHWGESDRRNRNKLLNEANVLYALKERNVRGVSTILARGITRDRRFYIKLKAPHGLRLSYSTFFTEYSIERKIFYFRRAAEILAAVHDHKIAHNAVHFENFIIDPKTDEPTIIGWGEAGVANDNDVDHDIANFATMLSYSFGQLPDIAALVSGMRSQGQQNPSYMHTVAELLKKLEKKLSTSVTADIQRSAASSGVTTPMDSAHKGGIDFKADNLNLQTQSSGEEIKFEMNPAQLKELQSAPGFKPFIIYMQPLTNVPLFLGLNSENGEKEKISLSRATD